MAFIPKRCPKFATLAQLLDSLAPLRLAAKWDNVGVLVDVPASSSDDTRPEYGVMFTNDITPAVLHEALAARVNAIVSYHPTPFAPMRHLRLGADNHAASVVLQCAHAGIGVYSPHTAWDIVANGLTDWLAQGIVARVLTSAPHAAGTPADWLLDGRVAIVPIKDVEVSKDSPRSGHGEGRTVSWPTAERATLAQLIAGVKSHLGLTHVHVALPPALEASSEPLIETAARMPLRSFAVVAGSGGSILGASQWTRT